MTEPLGNRIVPRPRLFELLDAAAHRQVTLVRAGPGWGKTALVSSWLDCRRRPTARLVLSPEHRDGRRLTMAVAAALEPAGVEIVDGCAHSSPVTVTLVLDDFQVLDGAAAANEYLATFLDRRLDWIRLVLLTRSEPGLPLHRLRASGELAEIGPADLAFDADEAAALPAGPDAVRAAEGWALGLRLAADHGDESVRDYLLREVVDAQPPAVRSFLLRTALPDRIRADLATALTGETHGQQILEQLQRTTGLVTRLPEAPRWFRYHHQLRDVLRSRFEIEEPDATPALHALIARWCAREGAVPEAMRHAQAAGDWPYVGRLVAERAVGFVVAPGRRLLLETLRGIPAELLPTTAELSLCAAMLMFVNGNLPALPACIARARAQLEGRPAEQRLACDVALDLLEAGAVTRVAGDMTGLVDATTRVLETLRPARLDQVPVLLQLRAIALSNKGVGLLWTGRLDRADQYLWAAYSAARSAAIPLTEVNAQAHLGILAYLQGSLGEAEAQARAARDLATGLGMATLTQAAMAHLAIALVELERNRVTEAQAALRQALHIEMNPPEVATTVVSALVRMHLLLTADDPAAARSVLASTRAEHPRLAVALDRMLRYTDAEAALALREPRRVVALYRLGGREGLGPRDVLGPTEQSLLGRAHLELGDHAAAEELLTRAARSPNMIAAVTAWIGLALLAEAQGHVNRSVDAMSRAGSLARRHGIHRPFRRFDPARIDALTGRQRWLEEEDAAPDLTVPEPAPELEPATTEALSERERDILRYLPTVLTAGEIAGSLGISINTVKAHMRAIYRKLGAARRREAVVRARHLGLL